MYLNVSCKSNRVYKPNIMSNVGGHFPAAVMPQRDFFPPDFTSQGFLSTPGREPTLRSYNYLVLAFLTVFSTITVMQAGVWERRYVNKRNNYNNYYDCRRRVGTIVGRGRRRRERTLSSSRYCCSMEHPKWARTSTHQGPATLTIAS